VSPPAARRCTAIWLAIGAIFVASCTDGSRSGANSDDQQRPASGTLDVDDAEGNGGVGDDASDGVPSTVCWSSDPADGEGIAWTRATGEMGLVEPLTGMHGHATAAGDVNGDGWTDLFVGGFADRDVEVYQERGATDRSPDRLLLGGPGGFMIDDSFEGELARTSGAAFADLDNDGDLDLVVVRNPRQDGEISSRPTTIFRNDGGSWSVASTLPTAARGRSVAIFDVDRDGLLDLLVAGDRFGDGSTRLYRNEGTLSFIDISDEWGLPDDMFALALAVVDLNEDGWLDVVVSGDERVLLGAADGFTISPQQSLEWELFGDEDDPAGIAIGDLDGDGRPDLVIGQHFNSTVDFGTEVPVKVFLNRSENGEVALVDVTADAGIPGLWTKSPHVAVVDVDGDGLADIVTSAATSEGVPYVLRNVGVDDSIPRFEPVGEPGDGQYWVTGAVDDFDRDGRADIFLVEWEPSLESPLFRGSGRSGTWVSVDIAAAGVDGVGARIEAWTPDRETKLATGWIESTTGYAAGAGTVARLGLGEIDTDEVDIVLDPIGRDSIEITTRVNSASRLGGC
jgi:hypothetical protein